MDIRYPDNYPTSRRDHLEVHLDKLSPSLTSPSSIIISHTNTTESSNLSSNTYSTLHFNTTESSNLSSNTYSTLHFNTTESSNLSSNTYSTLHFNTVSTGHPPGYSDNITETIYRSRPIISPVSLETSQKQYAPIKEDIDTSLNLKITKYNVEVSNSDSDRISEIVPQTWYPRVLVIGPGGAKGLKALGFLSPVEDSGLLEYVDTYCGVSVGAIICLLMICGYKIREIVGEAVKLDIFKEIGVFNFKSIMENKGFISNEPVRKLLTQLVINKFGNVPTLHGLYMRTGKAFVAVTLNATDEVCVMMNPFCTPDVSCVDATMFSMNIPFIFYQLIFKGKTYADGALANPYPVDYFDNGTTNILGIYMKTVYNKNHSSFVSGPSGTIIQKVDETHSSLPIDTYLLKIIHSLMDHRRNQIIQQASSCCKHICLETKTVDSIGYNVTTEDKALMLVQGFNEGKSFLSQLQNNTYKGPKIPEKLSYSYPPYYMIGVDPDTNYDESNKQENIHILTAMQD